jgi:hypothetical protein
MHAEFRGREIREDLLLPAVLEVRLRTSTLISRNEDPT